MSLDVNVYEIKSVEKLKKVRDDMLKEIEDIQKIKIPQYIKENDLENIKKQEELIKKLEVRCRVFELRISILESNNDSEEIKEEDLDKIQQNPTKNDEHCVKVENINLPNLKPQQEKFVFLLVEGIHLTDIAKELKVNRDTLYTWLNDDLVKTEYNKLRVSLNHQRISSLFKMQNMATEALAHALNSDSPNIRLKAAQYIIDKLDKTDIFLY